MHTTTTAVTWSCRDTRRLVLGLGRGLPLLRCPACKLQHCHDDQGKIPPSLWRGGAGRCWLAHCVCLRVQLLCLPRAFTCRACACPLVLRVTGVGFIVAYMPYPPPRPWLRLLVTFWCQSVNQPANQSVCLARVDGGWGGWEVGWGGKQQ